MITKKVNAFLGAKEIHNNFPETNTIFSTYLCFHDAFDNHNNNGDDKEYNGGDDYYKIFIADRRFRYSLLYSVLGFFATTLLEPNSKSKKATRRCLVAGEGR